MNKIRLIHAHMKPQYTVNAFYEEMLDCYVKSHCPECLTKLQLKQCNCKVTELM